MKMCLANLAQKYLEYVKNVACSKAITPLEYTPYCTTISHKLLIMPGFVSVLKPRAGCWETNVSCIETLGQTKLELNSIYLACR